MNLELYLTLYKNVNSSWIIDLNIRAKTIKFPEEHFKEHLYDTEQAEMFQNPESIDYKRKNLRLHQNSENDSYTDKKPNYIMENTFAKHVSFKVLLHKICEELLQLNSQTNSATKNGQKIWTIHRHKKYK